LQSANASNSRKENSEEKQQQAQINSRRKTEERIDAAIRSEEEGEFVLKESFPAQAVSVRIL